MGTRFFPATKTNPKEMFPIVDKPLIQYAAEEAISAGINELIFIEAPTKRSIKDHFVKAYELEDELKKKGKEKELQILKSIIPDNITCTYIPQPEPLGLGHAVLCAKSVIGDSSFIVLLPDDLIIKKNCSKAMISIHKKYKSSVMASMNVNKKAVSRWGIYNVKKKINKNNFIIKDVVEKPSIKDAPSNKAVIGRYILPKIIFKKLLKQKSGKGGEIHITDAIQSLLKNDLKFIGHNFAGKYLDCGTMNGYINSTLEIAKI